MKARLIAAAALTAIGAAAFATGASAQYSTPYAAPGGYGGYGSPLPPAPPAMVAPAPPPRVLPPRPVPLLPETADASGPSNATTSPVLEPTARGDTPAGILTPRDVVGKRLIDPNGLEIGRIEGAAGNGDVIVRGGGQRYTMPLSRLALGNGPNTVVAMGPSAADDLNRHELGSLNQ